MRRRALAVRHLVVGFADRRGHELPRAQRERVLQQRVRVARASTSITHGDSMSSFCFQ